MSDSDTISLTLDQWLRRGAFTADELARALRTALTERPGHRLVYLGRKGGKACYLYVDGPITAKADGSISPKGGVHA